MTLCKRKPDHELFHFYNANPLNQKTGDCVIRAIATFLDQSWVATYRELAEYGMGFGQMMDCPECYEPFLAEKGFKKERQPRKPNGKKYTVREFCKTIAEPGKCYIVTMAGHMAVVNDCRVWDTWDCGGKTVCNYWERGWKDLDI